MIGTCLWFDGAAQEAARFYVSLFPGSEITRVMRSAVDWPGGGTGDVILVEFTLRGARFQALNGGPGQTHTEAMSLTVDCEDQAELDRLWDALIADGGKPIMCGWLIDRFGVRWQIAPSALMTMMTDPDPDRARRATEAMLGMVKLDLAALTAAWQGSQ